MEWYPGITKTFLRPPLSQHGALARCWFRREKAKGNMFYMWLGHTHYYVEVNGGRCLRTLSDWRILFNYKLFILYVTSKWPHVSNHMPNKVWGEITYLFCTAEVKECIRSSWSYSHENYPFWDNTLDSSSHHAKMWGVNHAIFGIIRHAMSCSITEWNRKIFWRADFVPCHFK